MPIVFRLLLLLLMISSRLWANDSSSTWYTLDVDKKIHINVELFVSSTCKYCLKANEYFTAIEGSYPWLHVQRYIINEDKKALIRFNQLLTEQNMNDFAVPSVFFCNSRWVGFASAETTGKDLLYAINYCKQQIEKKGELNQVTINVLKRWANANLFDSGITGNPSAIKYIITVALMDAFNPCALFSIAGFFALLFLQNSRKKQLITGFLFILAVGVVHYFQQTYSSIFFEYLPWMRVPAAFAGLFTFYLAGQLYRKKSVHYLLFFLAFLLALMIQSYQQTCVMNWSYIFEQWLYNQHLSSGQAGIYQLAYQSMYLVPLLLTLFIYIILIRVKFFSKLNKKLNYIGLLIIMAIALILIIYPLALSNLALSLFVIVFLLISGLILNRYNNLE